MELGNLKLRRMRWIVIIAVLCGMLALFFAGVVQHRQQLDALAQRQRELSTELDAAMRSQSALNVQLREIGTAGAKDSAARSEDFVKPGELRFTIDNSQGVLEMYTEEEWKILMNERDSGLD